jgi:hypothetical protein
MLAEETIQGGNLSATQRPAERCGRLVGAIIVALAAMACVLGGPIAGVAAAEGLINNSPPFVTGHGRVGEEIVCDAGSWEAPGKVEFEFEWLSNGTFVATGNPYKVTKEDEGTSMTCVVIAKFGSGETEEIAEEESFNSVVIEGAKGTPPTNEELPKVTPASPSVGQTLTCAPGKWAGSPEIKFSYAWLRDGSPIEPAQTEEHYVVKTADEGHELSCEVTAQNNFGKKSATSRPVQVPATKPPEDEVAPEVLQPTGIAVGDALTCSPGKWRGEPTFAYAWFRDGKKIATGETYTIMTADETHHLSCGVTAENHAGAAEVPSSNSVLVEGTKPEAKTPPAIEGAPSGKAQVGHTLTCKNGEWGGVPEPKEFEYIWVRDQGFKGHEVFFKGKGSGGTEYVVEAADAGETLSCEVTAKNGVGAATALSESVIVESAGGPTNQEPPKVTPASPTVGQSLECEPGKWSPSVGLEFAYAWLRQTGSEKVLVASGEKYTVVTADAGHSLVCKVTAKDGNGSETAESKPIVVAAEAPQSVSKPEIIFKGKPAVNETLTCTSGTWKASPEPTFTYQWLREDVAIGPPTASNSYVVTEGDRGHNLTCVVTAKNAAGEEPARSEPLAIPGSLPVNVESKPPTIVGTLAVGEELECDPGEWTGTPAPKFTYQWTLETRPIPSATNRVLTVTVSDAGRTIYCEVTATIGTNSATVKSKGVKVPGSKPRDVELPEVSGFPGLGGTLNCKSGRWVGKPSPSFEYEWLRDGSSITGKSKSEAYTVTEADLGHTLACRVTATSGTEGSAEATSEGLEIPGGQTKVLSTLPTSSTPDTGNDPPGVTATSAQILAKLASELTYAQQRAHIATLLKKGAYKFAVSALVAGTLKLYWYEVPKGAHVSSAKHKLKPLLVASVTVSFAGPASKTVTLRLTSFGRGLLEHRTSIRLTGKAVFTPAGGRPVTWIKSFTLKK